ncbi:TRAP transporter substrate-binding protein [Thermodesulfobacteriota bacterium]
MKKQKTKLQFINWIAVFICCSVLFFSMNVNAEEQFSSGGLPGVITGTSEWERAFTEYMNAHGFDIKIYPFRALGNFNEASDMMRQGLLQYCTCGPFPFFRTAPVVFGGLIPYLFDDLDQNNRFLRSKGGFIDKVNETSTKAGIRMLDTVHTSGPMGLFTVKKPVRTLEDAKGLRLRFMAPPQKIQYEAIGAKGVGIPWPDVYTALQTGMVDGYVHGPNTALQFRHTEVFKYFTRLDFTWVSMGISMSESYYQSLSNEQKKVLHEAIEVARKANAKWMKTYVPKNLDRLREAGIEVITLSPEEKERFKSKINAVRNKMAPPPVVKFFEEGAKKFK